MAPETAVIVVAAGSGTRLGQPKPKALVDVSGRSILGHCLHSVFGMALPTQVIVVVPAAQFDEASRLCLAEAGAAAEFLTVVVGGATRQGSVAAGLAALAASVRTVLVHDAARAFTPSAQLDAVALAVSTTGAGVIPGLPVTDTIKQADAAGTVIRTVDRSELVAVQTPQGFPRDELVAAYATATAEYTDDAALFQAAGHAVRIVQGNVLAFKITTPWDLRRAETIVGERMPGTAISAPAVGSARIGVGTDVHAFDETQPLWLGALFWPGEAGLAGHSDGDALSHALCDALLSASGLGDVGGRFGTSDDRYAGAHGDVFISETVALVSDAGYAIGNVAVQVIAKHPRLSSRRSELEQTLSELVGAPVTVSGTTTDGLGFTGRGDGVAVIATALIHPIHRP